MGGGEVVQVHGGHIIRSTAGKKDRHSKVYTAKGPRDRRVRLAAHTAIQFYDVQDRLGFDRPSKAVDWLIEKAHYAIDKLPPLPPFDPNTGGEVNLTDVVYSPSLPPADSNLQESAGFGGSGYPHRDLCLSLQSFEPEGPFSAEYGGGWAPDPAEMGRFSRLLGWDGGGGERVTLQSNFQSQPLIRGWDGVQGDPTRNHMEQQRLGILGSDRFMEFCMPNQTSRDGEEDVNGMMMAGHHHHHRGASSMSTTTDSSH